MKDKRSRKQKNKKTTKGRNMNSYQEGLKDKMDTFVHFVYRVTKSFPREELFGTVSQFRRAALSVILNYIEGYARRRQLVRLHFLEISYGSLQEAKYLLDFSEAEKYVDNTVSREGKVVADEIGAMLWKEIGNLEGNKS